MINNNPKNSPQLTSVSPNSISTLGIRGRLFAGFGAIVITLVIAMVIILIKITTIEKISNEVYQFYLPSYDAYIDLNGQLYASQSWLQGYLLTHDPVFKQEFANSWNIIDGSQTSLDKFSKSWKSDILNRWNLTKNSIIQLKNIENKILNSPNGSELISRELLPSINSTFTQLDGQKDNNGIRTGGLFDINHDALQNKIKAIMVDMSTLRIVAYILILFGGIGSLIISLYTAHSILQYVNIFREHSNRVASGNLTERIRIQSQDEMGQLGNDLNIMTERLASIAQQITEASHNMVTTIDEVKHAVDAQSSGASEQASSINEITASLEEIEKSSMQTIEKAKSLGEVAEQTKQKGLLGLEAVEQSINGMKDVREKVQTIAETILELSNQTQQVGEITSVVNRLAQQSKMLALNASIEAAKAGEAGKGFAVVASEVKNLAEQSENSTMQVQKILEDISRATEKAVMATEEGTKGVDHGTHLVEQTGEIVRNLSDVIHDATMASQQIEAAIHQEGIGIEQITAGMNEINQVTASFVSSVQQTTEAIENLSTISRNLKKYIDVYKI
jgi:methyl-accepting chemotaxis protein